MNFIQKYFRGVEMRRIAYYSTTLIASPNDDEGDRITIWASQYGFRFSDDELVKPKHRLLNYSRGAISLSSFRQKALGCFDHCISLRDVPAHRIVTVDEFLADPKAALKKNISGERIVMTIIATIIYGLLGWLAVWLYLNLDYLGILLAPAIFAAAAKF